MRKLLITLVFICPSLSGAQDQYLIDWEGITRWLDRYPELREEFELLVADPDLDLGVLARKGAPRKSEPTAPASDSLL